MENGWTGPIHTSSTYSKSIQLPFLLAILVCQRISSDWQGNRQSMNVYDGRDGPWGPWGKKMSGLIVFRTGRDQSTGRSHKSFGPRGLLPYKAATILSYRYSRATTHSNWSHVHNKLQCSEVFCWFCLGFLLVNVSQNLRQLIISCHRWLRANKCRHRPLGTIRSSLWWFHEHCVAIPFWFNQSLKRFLLFFSWLANSLSSCFFSHENRCVFFLASPVAIIAQLEGHSYPMDQSTDRVGSRCP